MKKNTSLLAAWLLPLFLLAQESAQNNSLKLFIDCQAYPCEMDYIRQNINFVAFVNEVREADVFLLIKEQTSGGGGSAFTFAFNGMKRFAGQNDTLNANLPPDNTPNDRQKMLVKMLKAGLLRYVAKTDAFDNLDLASLKIKSDGDEDNKNATKQKDKYNNWVYRISGNGYFNGESSYQSLSMYSTLSASKTTEDWKLYAGLNHNLNKSVFKIDTTKYINRNDSYGLNSFVIKSLGEKWAIGEAFDIWSSVYSNLDWQVSFAPAIEYNIFPYKESATRELRLSYKIGYEYRVYADTTIFNKTLEHLFSHRIGIDFQKSAKWGSMGISLNAGHYLHNIKFNSVGLQTDFEVRIVKGLSLNTGLYLSLSRNQLGLRKGGATPEEILLRQRELASDYYYWGNVGISYSFGSIYNSVVNRRFGSGL